MNKIIIDGKEYELSAELVKKIKTEVAAQEKAENPFERKTNKRYYYIDSCDCIYSFVDDEGTTSKTLYSAGNYCRDKSIMEKRAMHEMLNRLLWRYSEMHGGDSNPWPCGEHWFIYCNTANGNEMMVSANDSHKKQGTIYFKDRVIAKAAIEEVVKPFLAAHPEFVW